MSTIVLHEDERIDDLQFANLHIIQSENDFRFSMDSVLLSDFATLQNRIKVCDLGTGTGIIPLLLYGRNNTISCDAVEILPSAAERAARSMELNGVSQSIVVHCADLRDIRTLLPHGKYALVTSNPPYASAGAAIPSPYPAIQGARQEETCTFEDIVVAVKWLLKYHGRFCFMLPAFRLAEAFSTLKAHQLEPKRIRMVHSKHGKEARLVLVEAMKGVSSGVQVLPPLIIHNDDGTDTEELKRIYHQI
ncbi:MAG: tRNA1(Val) (adenine(37)-N6)-methyltransferase [Clostridia bacterium]|nr:tRNA1(Val) (adenine(37)-N6)-methyltransferase [Clostridia bacterium]